MKHVRLTINIVYSDSIAITNKMQLGNGIYYSIVH